MATQKNGNDKITIWLKAMNYSRKNKTEKNEICDHVTVEFMYNEIVARYDKILYRYNGLVDRYSKIVDHYNEILFCYSGLVDRYNRLVDRYNGL